MSEKTSQEVPAEEPSTTLSGSPPLGDEGAAPSRWAPLESLLHRPWLALLGGTALWVAALRVGAGFRPGDRSPVDPIPGYPVATRIGLAACFLLLIGVSRVAPRARDYLHIALGAAFMCITAGVRCAAGLFAITLLVHYGLRRVHTLVAMLVTAACIVLAAHFLFFPATQSRAYSAIGAVASLNVLYYAFEVQVVPRKRRSIVSTLAYAPFNIALWPGPLLVSYLTLTTPKPRADLDRLGSRQLWRSGAKMLLLSALLQFEYWAVPGRDRFPSSPLIAQLAVLPIPYLAVFLWISARADLGAGVANLAGYHVPDPFQLPLLAPSPYQFWRRWNVHVVGFLQRVFIYQAVRIRHSVVMAVLAGLLGTGLVHLHMRVFDKGYTLSSTVGFLEDRGPGLLIMLTMLLALFPLELLVRRVNGTPQERRWIIALTIVTQSVCVLLHFISYFGLEKGGTVWSRSTNICLLLSIFDRTRVCQ